MRVIDLTMPLRPHWRWRVSLERVRNFGPGQPFQISEFHGNVHAFTHVDSPLHVVPGAPTIAQIPIERLAGPAAVIDLSHKGPGEPILPEELERGGGHVQPGDLILLRTCWDKKYSFESQDYWAQACYVTEGAAQWLYERAPSAVGYDFPQDRPLRVCRSHGDGGDDASMQLEEFATHHLLLARGILNIEYLVNLHQLRSQRPHLFALPLLLDGAEAAPARVVAVEA
ncbi:MAG: cyclase family protein [Chloroflexota bacterium]